MSSFIVPMRNPPKIPMASAQSVRSGRATIIARNRGTTRKRTGSAASVRSASICSVTCIVPSSAAMDEPTRPATMSAVMTGPISRTTERATRLAM